MRWFLAVICMTLSIIAMVKALRIESLGAAPQVLGSVLLFLLAVVLIAPETAVRLAEMCSLPVTNLIFPSARFSRPPLSYNLARRCRDTNRFGEALEEYKSIIHYYPRERAAYLELLAVAEKLGDEKTVERYMARMRRQFGASVELVGQGR